LRSEPKKKSKSYVRSDEAGDARDEALNDVYYELIKRVEEIKGMERSEASGLRNQIQGLEAAIKIVRGME